MTVQTTKQHMSEKSAFTPGQPDTMYTETTGYGKDTVATWWEGRNVGGATIGLIQLRANVAMVPGNIGNASTFDFPLLYQELVADNVYDVMSLEPVPSLTEQIVHAAKELERQGVKAIMGNCGFFATYHPVVAPRINTPFFPSSLLQLPMILMGINPQQKVAVICANCASLGESVALKNCGVTDEMRKRVVIGGCEDPDESPEFHKMIFRQEPELHLYRLEKEISAAVSRIRERHDIGAILLECTEMGPHAHGVARFHRLPVWDYTTLTKWVHEGVLRRPFTGFI
jgi:hypothetical protein